MAVVREERVVARRRRKGRWLPLVAVISLGAWAAVTLQPAPVAELPSDIRGTWITDDPRYQDRSLMLGRNEITVVHPEGREVTVVREVQLRRRPDTLALVIRHGEVAGIQTLSLAVVGGTDEHLLLGNPAAVRWVRQVGGDGAPNDPASASPLRAGESAPR